MGLDDFIPDEWPSESGWNAAEAAEKYKEAAKKAASWIKRTQKDEWKAKKYDDLLSHFLVLFIRDKKYDSILDSLFKSLDSWYSSNFILWVLSIIYMPVSYKIREISWKEKINFNYINNLEVTFDDSNLNINLKNRINDWVDDISLIMTTEYSNVSLEKVINLLKKSDKNIVDFTKNIFIFFLKENNIIITENKANSYADFIIWEISNKIQKIEIEEI